MRNQDFADKLQDAIDVIDLNRLSPSVTYRENVRDDMPKLTAALDALMALSRDWREMGERMIRNAANADEDAQKPLRDAGMEFLNRAQDINRAIGAELGVSES